MAKYTQAQLDALRAAYARGLRTVSDGESTVTYQNLDAMRAVIEEMEADLANPTRARVRVVRATVYAGR